MSVGETHGKTRASPVTTDEAKTKILRRPSLSESGPETTVASRMPARLITPMRGMTVCGSVDAEVVGEDEQLVARDPAK